MCALVPLERESGIACVPGNQGDETHSSETIESIMVQDVKIGAKPTLGLDGFLIAAQPRTSSFNSRAVNDVERHKLECLSEIKQLPTSTCASLSNDSDSPETACFGVSKWDLDNMACLESATERKPESAPGAYAVQIVRMTPPSFTQSSATARSSVVAPRISSSVMDEEVGRSHVVASPTNTVLLPSTDSISNLAEAKPVFEDTEGCIMMHANAVDQNKVQKRQHQISNQEKLCGVALFLLVLGGAIIFGSVVQTHPNTSREDAATQAPTPYVSMAPSPAPTRLLDAVFVDLPLHTQDSILNGNTPQYHAWEWLSKHQNITKLPDWRKNILFCL
jgi:hypothetical protein